MTQHAMLREIREQPNVLRNQCRSWQQQAKLIRADLEGRPQLVLLGRGSSGNACTVASYLYAALSGRQAIEFRPWLVTLDESGPERWDDCFVLAFSASGMSTDVSNAARWLRDRGAFVVGVTNAEADADELHLGKACEKLFRLHAGSETAVPATKSFTAQLFGAAALCGAEIVAAAEQTAECFAEVLAGDVGAQLAQFIGIPQNVFWLARGYSLGGALDAALKLQETAGVHSQAYSTAEFLHGPVAAAGQNDRAIVFVDSDGPDRAADTAIAALLNRGTPVFVISGRSAAEVRSPALYSLPFPQARWARAAILTLAAQLAAYEHASRRGLNPDAPAGLNKITLT